jgi:aryl-alcohol dehydrogenase-like predicted oxidoreductase
MRYRTIPNTDLSVSAVCLGAADMGSAIDEATSFLMLDQFLDAGGTFLDTALVYADWVPGGQYISELTLGRWLHSRGARGHTHVATKGGHPPLKDMQLSRLSQAEIAADVETSLRNLQLDTIDLYYLHRDDPARPVEDIVESLHGLVESGKLRYVGCSNWRAPRIRAAQQHAATLGWCGFVADQMLWNMAVVDISVVGDPTIAAMDADLYSLHCETGLAAVPWSSQANGLFDKMSRGAMDSLRPLHKKMYASPENERRFSHAAQIAAETGLSINQIALGYLISQPFVTIPVVGPRSPAQLADTLRAGDVTLSAEQVRLIETTY